MTEEAVSKHLQFNAPTQFSSISQTPENTLILQSSVSEVKLCPLDSNYNFNRRPHATAMNITSGDGTALCALFLPCGEAVENFQMIKESSSYTSGKRGVLNLHPVFIA